MAPVPFVQAGPGLIDVGVQRLAQDVAFSKSWDMNGCICAAGGV
jgi:hypothetical protein